MKRIILFIILIIASSWCLSAQDTLDKTHEASPVQLERVRGRLCDRETGMKLDNTSLCQILSQDDYALYQKARRKYIAAIPFWAVSGICLGAATYWWYEAISYHVYFKHTTFPYDEYEFYPVDDIFCGCFCGFAVLVSIVFFTPAITLTLDSFKKIDRVVSSYNQKTNPISLSFGPTRHGVGITLNF